MGFESPAFPPGVRQWAARIFYDSSHFSPGTGLHPGTVDPPDRRWSIRRCWAWPVAVLWRRAVNWLSATSPPLLHSRRRPCSRRRVRLPQWPQLMLQPRPCPCRPFLLLRRVPRPALGESSPRLTPWTLSVSVTCRDRPSTSGRPWDQKARARSIVFIVVVFVVGILRDTPNTRRKPSVPSLARPAPKDLLTRSLLTLKHSSWLLTRSWAEVTYVLC